jgi:threonine synthase
VVYYFAGYFYATKSNTEKVSFTVPSGNFGNVCAGHVARMMGLPIEQLVVATNENNVLDEFFRTGSYRVRGSAETYETSSPSMDISKASNFERFVFDLLGRDGARVKALFKDEVEQRGVFTLTPEEFAKVAGYGFVSGCSTHADRLDTIRDTFERDGTMIDTHTADGLKVARQYIKPGVTMIVLETALAAKFEETIIEATGQRPARPHWISGLEGMEDLPKRFVVMDKVTQSVKDYVVAHCAD